jgi:hypothetical protein
MNDPASFQNWLPIKLISNDNKLHVEWIFLSDVRFTKPFFDENITACKMANSMPANQIKNRITSLNFIIEVARTIETFQPALFIFHTSRCGSTLASQLLCLDEENIVIPEFEMIDSILRINEKGNIVSERERTELIESIILLAGQKRYKNQKRLIIKLDSWHFYYYKELINLFPKSKQMVFFRDPDSIFNSIIKKPGIQFIPELISPLFYGLDLNSEENYDSQKYINNVLISIYSTIEQMKIHNSEIMFHNYKKGMDEILFKIYEFLGIKPDLKIADLVKQRLLYHSKNPGFIHTNDAEIPNPLIKSETRNAFRRIEELSEKDR